MMGSLGGQRRRRTTEGDSGFSRGAIRSTSKDSGRWGEEDDEKERRGEAIGVCLYTYMLCSFYLTQLLIQTKR